MRAAAQMRCSRFPIRWLSFTLRWDTRAAGDSGGAAATPTPYNPATAEPGAKADGGAAKKVAVGGASAAAESKGLGAPANRRRRSAALVDAALDGGDDAGACFYDSQQIKKSKHVVI